MLAILTEIFGLLYQAQPLTDETDVFWVGPYYITRSGVWVPTYFRIDEVKLHIFVSMPKGDSSMIWDLGSRHWEFTSPLPFGFGGNAEKYWTDVLTQVKRSLRAALKNPSVYNRMVEARLPLAYRTGKIQRAFTRPKDEEPAMGEDILQKLECMHSFRGLTPQVKKLTVADYLATAAIAYDAAFGDLRSLSPVEKYKSRADGRHGGMLDLPLNNARAFTQWFQSRRWAGQHPWEIVYGNPHGTMLSPCYDATTSTWSFDLSVHTPSLYAKTVEMAIALAAHAIPIEFHDCAKVIAVLRGTDTVEVGPSPQFLLFEELQMMRPDALRHIQWDAIPQINPFTPDQLQRLCDVIPLTFQPDRPITARVRVVHEGQAVGIPHEEIKEAITAPLLTDRPTTEREEKERANMLDVESYHPCLDNRPVVPKPLKARSS